MIPDKSLTTLSPAGDARRELLAERQDALEEQLEGVGDEVGRIDPKALEVENELAQHFNELEVSNRGPGYMYGWVYSGQHGRMIRLKITEQWEVVQGDMREAEEMKGIGTDTTRRLGDVILMRIRKDRYVLLQRREAEKGHRQQEGVTSTLEEMGESLSRRGIVVHTDLKSMNPQMLKRMQNRAAAQKISTGRVAQWLREGRMPGTPAPGAAKGG